MQRSKIKSRIKVHVKTLHGKRATHKITLDILEPLEKIRERLFELEPTEMAHYHSLKLVHPMGKLRSLPLDQSPAALNLMSGARLLLLGVKEFRWDPKYKNQGLQLADNDQRAYVHGQHHHAPVLASMGFNAGRHYWEIRLEHYASEQDVFAGVCPKQRCESLVELVDVYGWICTQDKKLVRAEGKPVAMEHYGDYSSIGDTIGVLLEFSREGTASLTFYKNGRSEGLCFSGMPPQTYFPCVALAGTDVVVTLNSKAKLPQRLR